MTIKGHVVPVGGPRSKRAFDLPEKSPQEVKRAGRILAALKKRYPDVRCELDFTSPQELLVATILSAQATDVGVNKATPGLFKRFPTPADYLDATVEDVEPYVKTLNFWRNKAKSVHATMCRLQEHHEGQVPRTMEELLALRGVARKTANVVLGNAFGINNGVVVDTHVGRISRRFGLTEHEDPIKVERDLMALFPRPSWCILSHLCIFHGRRVCKARGALCEEDAICRRHCTNVET
ncbi:MAG: endonuclease III [Phycisphaerae bacterium]|nr:endonuclease III [Phycisphaerae bacterium]HAW95423.1 endonuclease III [Phycisphaerales bacterium]